MQRETSFVVFPHPAGQAVACSHCSQPVPSAPALLFVLLSVLIFLLCLCLPASFTAFLIATSSSSSTWFLCSSSFCITMCLLPSFLPWCSGADRDCIETGRRNWLPTLFSWNTGSRVVLEVFFWSCSMWLEQASRCLGTLGPGEVLRSRHMFSGD